MVVYEAIFGMPGDQPWRSLYMTEKRAFEVLAKRVKRRLRDSGCIEADENDELVWEDSGEQVPEDFEEIVRSGKFKTHMPIYPTYSEVVKRKVRKP